MKGKGRRSRRAVQRKRNEDGIEGRGERVSENEGWLVVKGEGKVEIMGNVQGLMSDGTEM